MERRKERRKEKERKKRKKKERRKEKCLGGESQLLELFPKPNQAWIKVTIFLLFEECIMVELIFFF